MYIKRIRLKNIRCLPNVDLKLDKQGNLPRFIVVAGRNGAGKTSFLQAIALGIYGDHLGKQYASNWTKRGEMESSVQIDLDLEPGLPNEGLFKFLVNKMQYSSDLLQDLAERTPALFLVGYGPMRRLNGEASFHASRDAQSPEDRVITLFHEGAALREIVSWIQSLYTRKLEGKEGAQQLFDDVLAILGDGLLPEGGTVTKVDSDGIHLSLGVPSRTEFLHQSSDGYRTMVAMVLDILRQLHHIQGLQISGDGVLIENQGVVLIDELDAHLHVSWQSTIGFWLKKHFPNIQFIVTTHSPFICQAADPGGLVRLPRQEGDQLQILDESDYYTVVHGTVDDAMLSTLFGLERTHSNVSQDLRQRLAQLDLKLARETITEAELQERENLERYLPTSGTAEVSRLLRQLGAK